MLLWQREHIRHENVENVPSVHHISSVRATLDFGQSQSVNVLEAGVQGARNVSAPRVPLLDLAKLHAANSSLHVQHPVVAAVVRKIMHRELRFAANKRCKMEHDAHHDPVALVHGVQLRVQREVLALGVVRHGAQ